MNLERIQRNTLKQKLDVIDQKTIGIGWESIQQTYLAQILGMWEKGQEIEKSIQGGGEVYRFSSGDKEINYTAVERDTDRDRQHLKRWHNIYLDCPDYEKYKAIAEDKATARANKWLKSITCETKLLEDQRPFSPGKYQIIYADPPWKYSDELIETYGAATHHYPLMTIEEICNVKDKNGKSVKDIVDENAVLFLWVTSPLLDEWLPIIEAWGFQYKASFIWDKVKHNYGHYNSVRHEVLLLCTRGSYLPETDELIDSVVSEERSDIHSQKPEKFREIIDTLYPSGKAIELFYRGDPNKLPARWKVWGLGTQN